MDRETAHKVLALTLESQRVSDQQWYLQQQLGIFSWDRVCSQAMEFLVKEEQNESLYQPLA